MDSSQLPQALIRYQIVHALGAGQGGVPGFRHQLKTDGLKLPGTGLFGRFWAPFLPLWDFRL